MVIEGIEKVIRNHAHPDPNQPKVIQTTGIVNTSERDYSIIKNVEKINGDNRSLARKRSMSRTRSLSKSRPPTQSKEWDRRDTKENTIGGLAKHRLPPSGRFPVTKEAERFHSQAAFRSRSRSRQRSMSRSSRTPEERTASNSQSGRGRSSSRVRSAIKGVKNVFGRTRGSSRSRTNTSTEEPRSRGRSVSRREGPESELPPVHRSSKGESKKLMDSSEVKSPSPEHEKLESDAEPEPEPEPEKKKSEIDGLKDHDVMQLDDKNTVMHVACLLHHNTGEVIERLEEDPSLAFELNNAEELPLHYAAMDKKGVNHDVLKKLLRINPDGVKQRNVQNSLPIHLACMVGAPSQYALKTFLKMYPKSAMIQSDFPLLFEKEMIETVSDDSSCNSDDSDEFVAYKPTQNTKASGVASFFACAAPSQAELELAQEVEKKREKSSSKVDTFDEGPQIETGFAPLHLAVMNSAHPSVIDLLLNANAKCAQLKSSKGRTALDCAQFIIRQHWLYGTDDEGAVKNTFAAIEILEEAAKKDFEDE